jgi:hypothetical protein
MQDAPMGFVVAMTDSLAEATMDFMAKDPANADEHCGVGSTLCAGCWADFLFMND